MHLTRLIAALALVFPAWTASALDPSLVLCLEIAPWIHLRADFHLLLQRLAEVLALHLLALHLEDLHQHVVAHLPHLRLHLGLLVLGFHQLHLVLV